jgi:uncharacterized protein YcfL
LFSGRVVYILRSGGKIMKTVLLFILAALLTGCMSQEAVLKLVDQQIAANNSVLIQPALTQQAAYTAALAVSVEKNSRAVAESSTLVGVHQDVLLGLFQKQQETAAFALDKLAPKPELAQLLEAPVAAPGPAPVADAVTPE